MTDTGKPRAQNVYLWPPHLFYKGAVFNWFEERGIGFLSSGNILKEYGEPVCFLRKDCLEVELGAVSTTRKPLFRQHDEVSYEKIVVDQDSCGADTFRAVGVKLVSGGAIPGGGAASGLVVSAGTERAASSSAPASSGFPALKRLRPNPPLLPAPAQRSPPQNPPDAAAPFAAKSNPRTTAVPTPPATSPPDHDNRKNPDVLLLNVVNSGNRTLRFSRVPDAALKQPGLVVDAFRPLGRVVDLRLYRNGDGSFRDEGLVQFAYPLDAVRTLRKAVRVAGTLLELVMHDRETVAESLG